MITLITRYLAPLRIALLTFTAFLPSLWNGFVDWDDSANLVENPHYRGLGWSHLHWMFTTFHLGPYQPLSWMSLGMDYLIWGMNPFGYHLTSLLLHTANAVLSYLVALRLLEKAVPGSRLRHTFYAQFAALFFAIHPLRVESVAWATERRDTLSGFFFLLTVLTYLRAVEPTRERRTHWKWLAISAFLFALSLLSKAIGMTLPLLLLLLDIYPLRRLHAPWKTWWKRPNREVFLEKVPFFLLSLGAGIVAIIGQLQAGAAASWEAYGLDKRLAQSVYALVFYLWKTVAPTHLTALYEVPPDFNPRDGTYLLCGAAVVMVTVTSIVLRKRWPPGIAAWSSYFLLLSPVLGIVATGPQIAADRYTYLSCLPWALLAGAGILYFQNAFSKGQIRKHTLVALLAGALSTVAALGILTWRQTRIWHDDETFWGYTVRLRPRAWIANGNYANTRYRQGDLKGAAEYYRRSLRLHPANEKAHYYLANTLLQDRKFEEAIKHYRAVLRLNPRRNEARLSLGNALLGLNRIEEAIEQYRLVLAAEPTHAAACNNLGNMFLLQGKTREAIHYYRMALRLKPDHLEACYNLAAAYAKAGRFGEAIEAAHQALKLALSQKQVKLAEKIRSRIALYESAQP